MLSKTLMLAAAVAISYGLADVRSAGAVTWACGAGYTCYTPPCKAGDTQLPNGDGPNGEYNYDHCVGGGALHVANGTAALANHNLSNSGAPTCKAGEKAVTRNGKAECLAPASASHQMGDMPK